MLNLFDRSRKRTSSRLAVGVFALVLAITLTPIADLSPAPGSSERAFAVPTGNDQDSANPVNPSGGSGSNTPGAAESSLPLEEQVALFESRVNNLGVNLEKTSEEINLAKEQLQEIRTKIAQREGELDAVRKEYEDSQEILSQQAAAEYREGPASYLEILLSSKDIPSMLDKYEFLRRLSQQQKSAQDAIAKHKKSLEDELLSLKQDELDAQSLEFELEAKQIEMNHRKAEYEELFKQANQAVLREYQRNSRQRAIVDQQNLRAFLSGGYTVEKGGVVETALTYRGIPYVWGGESKQGMDCSGFVLYVFKQHGVKLPHSSAAQSKMGTPVPLNQLQPGDAVFFGSPVHHVGIYIGGEYFIHAPTFGDVVKVSKLTNMSDYVGARRYDWSARSGTAL